MAPPPDKAYKELVGLSRANCLVSSCADLLSWDEETYMPRGGVAHRAEQCAAVAGLLHERATAARVGELLAAVEGSALVADLGSPRAVNVREFRRQYDREVRLPRALVEEKARLVPVAQRAWLEAREEDDFSRFFPSLERVVSILREEAQVLGFTGSPLDPLLDLYEPGLTAERAGEVLTALCAALRPIADAVAASTARPAAGVLRREFPVDRQRLFAQAVAASMGFDLECGRIDTGAHPSCVMIGPGDVRLTARFFERDLRRGFFAVLHEVGHGLYDQGLDRDHYGTPMGQAPSLGVHESQARLWENLVGRGRAFWAHFYPRLRNVFHESLADVPPEVFYAAVNRVEPSLSRADADELTYDRHVLIRFELERGLLEGRLAARDLPDAWRAAYRAGLGVEPATDAEGCLQDGHWASAMFGYFPTYSLGNVYAGQLFAAANAAIGSLDDRMSRGQFADLVAWLREAVFRHGHRFRAEELIRRACGTGLDPGPLVGALRRKYAELYGL